MPIMCGIFAYMGHQPIPVGRVIEILRILENEQEPGEPSQVGGHGAGIAFLNWKHELAVVKTGKTTRSPVSDLGRQLSDRNKTSQVILGHVRRASLEFENTISFNECAQPYKPTCTFSDCSMLSAHNGFLQNYRKLKDQLAQQHKFESEEHTLVDSEVIAHLYEESLNRIKDSNRAAHTLHEQIEGNNTIIIIVTNKLEAYLYAIHRGKTRGLRVWTNLKGEVLLCSREHPVRQILSGYLVEGNYQEIITIQRAEKADMQACFTLEFRQPR